jgi:AbrB family looped-hinge helix DNA binding protein
METTLDRFGRVVIPKRIRDDLGLLPGTVLKVEERGGAVNLSPLEEEAALAEEDGVLVFRGRAVGDLDAAVDQARRDRLDELATAPLR